MMRKQKILLLILIMFIMVAMPFARSMKSQNPIMNMAPEDSEKGPYYYCNYVIPYDYIWVSLKSSLYNDCFGNYAMTVGTNAWWPGVMANPDVYGGWSALFAGWQYPKNIGDHQAGQIVYDQNVMWGAKSVVSDFLYNSDIQSPEDSLAYYPQKYNGLISFYGFYFAFDNEDMEHYSQSDYLTFIDDSESKTPLDISGTLRNLRWNYPNADDFNIHILTLKNNSTQTYNPFYFGIYMDADVNAGNAAANVSYFDQSIGTAYIMHPTKSLGVVGITVFDTTAISTCRLDVGYDETANFADPWVWDIMNSNEIQTSVTKPYDARIILILGPYSLAPGATQEISWANPNGYDLGKFLNNVKIARDTKNNNWMIPNPPPESPFLFIETGDREVYLKWSRNRNYFPKPLPKGQQGFYTDPDLGLANPDPSPTYSPGSESAPDPASLERDWNGYRVYRNMTGMGDIELGDYALVVQLDATYVYNNYGSLKNSAELDKQTWTTTYWCDYTDTDPSLFNGFTYYYSVCAYDTGDRSKTPPIDPSYSSALVNVQPATLSWHKETTPTDYQNKVEVVPNPFIEGQYANWQNNVRKVDFIHLPEKCTIKVYTLSGMKVRTIEHNASDADESWNLTNDKGQNLAPGVYIYRVIPDTGSEITGKLMIIR